MRPSSRAASDPTADRSNRVTGCRQVRFERSEMKACLGFPTTTRNGARAIVTADRSFPPG